MLDDDNDWTRDDGIAQDVSFYVRDQVSAYGLQTAGGEMKYAAQRVERNTYRSPEDRFREDVQEMLGAQFADLWDELLPRIQSLPLLRYKNPVMFLLGFNHPRLSVHLRNTLPPPTIPSDAAIQKYSRWFNVD